MAEPTETAAQLEAAIRAYLRDVREREGLTFRQMEQRYGIGHWWIADYLYGHRPLHHRSIDAQKRRLYLAFPELRELLTALSLSWIPDANGEEARRDD